MGGGAGGQPRVRLPAAKGAAGTPVAPHPPTTLQSPHALFQPLLFAAAMVLPLQKTAPVSVTSSLNAITARKF